MKSNTFNYSLLAVGVAALMGVSTGAMAAQTAGAEQDGADIKNVATANYKVGTVDQPKVTSNEVIVSVKETPRFSLVSNITDGDNNADTAINQEATPGGLTPFTHLLTNEGNITDTYTIATNAINTSIGGTPDYTFASANISYSIDVSGLTAAQKTELQTLNPNTSYSSDGTTASGTLTSTNDEITLLPGLVAELSYDASTPTTQDGGDTGEGTITATSSVITGQPTLTNENQTLVKLPVFKIEKSATCNGATGPCTSLNLNTANTDVNYSIKVTNVTTDYSKAADNFVIRDVLPLGMTLNSSVVTPSGLTVDSAGRDTSERQVIDITVPSLAVGADLTVNFTVNVDKAAILAAGNTVTNDATVYDNYDNTTPDTANKDNITSDISDSTNDVIDNPKVPADGEGTDGEDTTPTITLTDRNLTITDGTTKEVPVEGSVGYSHTIENEGNANEGGTTRPINITITDPNGNTPLDVINPVYVDSNNVEQLLEVINAATGQYKLPDSVILAPNQTVEIRYTVNSVGDNTNLNDSDTNVLTVTSTGTDASSDTAQNTTTIKGLTLLKQAALQVQCKGTIGSYGTGTSTTAVFSAEPGDCIYYQITATNTFTNVSNTAIENVVVSDKTSNWGTQATYTGDADAISSTGSPAGLGTDSDGDDAVITNLGNLASGASANLTFAVKVNP